MQRNVDSTIISMIDEMTRRAFKALGDPTRLHIVEFLSKMCGSQAALTEEGGVLGPTASEVCCHITGAEKITSNISQHLHELEDSGLIQIERRGRHMVCTLHQERLLELSSYLQNLATISKDSVHGCQS